MENKKDNKMSDAHIKASRKYDEKNNLVTIACKITKEYKIEIESHYKSKGYTSMNSYLLDLIKKDMEQLV